MKTGQYGFFGAKQTGIRVVPVLLIVESFGGEYLVRTEQITSLHSLRKPQRVIIIRFPSRQALEACFASEAYQRIIKERIESVDARALIVDGDM